MGQFLFEHASYPLAGALVVLAVAAWVVMLQAATKGWAKTAIVAGLVTVLAAPAFTSTLMMVGPKHQIEQSRVEFRQYLDDTYGTPEEQAAEQARWDAQWAREEADALARLEREHRQIRRNLQRAANRLGKPVWGVKPNTTTTPKEIY